MKTEIKITGSGIKSKLTLLRAIQSYDCELKDLPFNDFLLTFRTKKEATEALSEARKYLKSDIEDWKASCGSYARGLYLHYDAGIAQIINH